MSKRDLNDTVTVNFRNKPLASDSYPTYLCEAPHCTCKIKGYRGNMGWVNSRKVRQASIEKFGIALCSACWRAKDEGRVAPHIYHDILDSLLRRGVLTSEQWMLLSRQSYLTDEGNTFDTLRDLHAEGVLTTEQYDLLVALATTHGVPTGEGVTV